MFYGAGIARVCSIYSFSFTKTSIIGSKAAEAKKSSSNSPSITLKVKVLPFIIGIPSILYPESRSQIVLKLY